MWHGCRELGFLKLPSTHMPRRLVRNIDYKFRQDRMHRGHNQVIPENKYSADCVMSQVLMINDFASETCHRIAFLVASDLRRALYFRMSSTSSTWLESTQYWWGQLSSMSSSKIPPMCLPQPEAEHDEAPSNTVHEDGPWACFFIPSPSCCCGARARSAFLSVSPQQY